MSTVPAGMLLQTPRDAVSAHDLQIPVQAVWQQIPCSQKVDRHSSLLVQMAPAGLRPQSPFAQVAGGRQSASAVHVALQAAVPQRYGKQDDVPGTTQVPAPSQLDSAVNRLVVVGQVAGMQGVFAAHFWQAPAWHRPFRPQVDWSSGVHWPVGSRAPPVTSVHWPSWPTLHDLHAPVQAWSQQTPWAQKLLLHSFGSEQDAPLS